MKKLRIFITGGTGFIGKNLIPIFNKKYNIKILTRQNIKNKKFIKGDLMNYNSIKDSLKNIDVIIHLAYSKKYPENLIILDNLIKSCRENGVKKIILLSSMSAKRSSPDNYGKNKLEIEKKIKESNINYTILRPSIIYGKGSTSFDFIIDYIRKIPFFVPIIGTGRYTIIPVHIKDVVESIEKCIKNKKTDKKEYDIVGGEKIYFINLINVLKKEIKIKKKNLYIPICVCKIIAAIFPILISKENIKNLTEDSLADINAAKKDFNFNPIKFKEGMKNGLV